MTKGYYDLHFGSATIYEASTLCQALCKVRMAFLEHFILTAPLQDKGHHLKVIKLEF